MACNSRPRFPYWIWKISFSHVHSYCYNCCRVRLYRKLPLGLAISGSSSLFSFMIITRSVFFGGFSYSYSLHYINLIANSFAIIGPLCILFLIIILVRVFAITGVSFIINTFIYRDRSFAITGALRIHYWLLLALNPLACIRL